MFNTNDEFPHALVREGIRANIVGNEINIWISYISPSQKELELFQHAPIEFGVISSFGVLIFAYRFGDNNWQDTCYSYEYSKILEEKGEDIFIEPTIEKLLEEEPIKLVLYFFDSENKRIIGRRILKLKGEMKTEIIKGLTEQKNSQDHLLSNLPKDSVCEAFQMVKDFFQGQPIEYIIEPLVKQVYY